MAQADMFLKLTNIKGEALDSKHKDEIEVLSWSFGASQSGSAHWVPGRAPARLRSRISPSRTMSTQSSTDLLKHLTNGKHIDEGMLTVRKAGGTAVEYFKLKMDTSHGHSHQQWWRRRPGSGHRERDPQLPQVHADLHGTGRQGQRPSLPATSRGISPRRPSDGCKFGECDGTSHSIF